MASCPFCAEPVAPAAPKCPHCGEALVDRAELIVELEQVAPDLALAAHLAGWPDDSLLRALRDHADDYDPPRQRALLDEARRRGLSLPTRARGGRSIFDRVVTLAGCSLLGAMLLLLALKVMGALR